MGGLRRKWRQAPDSCAHCSSYYVVLDRGVWTCNVCNGIRAIPENYYTGETRTQNFNAGKHSSGKTWDRKKHRYLKQGETKEC